MDEFDITYRALKDYQENTSNVPEIRAFLDEMHSESNRTESLECSASICKIDRDWVDEIDRALPFVADAVMENRQFVRSDGEVVPIEKVRTVGKETVVDLSKHSNYITRDPASTGGRIIPDKLMMPQKDNDYAIYENRFLYSLLVYLSQFIEIRLNEIMAITGKYEAKTKITKKLKTPLRNLSYELSFEDVRFNDPFAAKRNSSADALNTIKQCLNQAKSLLMTPLMKEVSKAAMVHPPIVKTNVFRFDHNFKESLALYNFLQTYDKKGFEIENVVTKLSPFQTKVSENFSTLVYLTGYLTYVHGNKMEDVLKKAYIEEEKKRKEEADKKLLAEIKRVGRNIRDSGLSPEEYILMLQKGNQVLEKNLAAKENEVEETKNIVQQKVKDLTIGFQKELDEEKEKMTKSIEDQVNELALNSLTKVKEYTAKVNSMQELVNKTNQEKQAELTKSYQERVKLDMQYKKQISDLNAAHSSKTTELNGEIEKARMEVEKAKKEIERLKANQVLLEGQVNNLRAMNRQNPTKDFTEEEFFDELEKEKLAFDAYFEKTWKATKKRIRKETLKLDKEEIKNDVAKKKVVNKQKRTERWQNISSKLGSLKKKKTTSEVKNEAQEVKKEETPVQNEENNTTDNKE